MCCNVQLLALPLQLVELRGRHPRGGGWLRHGHVGEPEAPKVVVVVW
jgi:hypothetical protein